MMQTPLPDPLPLAAVDLPATEPKLLRNGAEVQIRRIRAEDAALERDFLERLSPQSRRQRFLGAIKISAELIERLTHPDPAREVAFVALVEHQGQPRIVGVSRYCASADGRQCESAVTVADDWQTHGLGTLLMHQLIIAARQAGIATMLSMDSASNAQMHVLARVLGFTAHTDPEDATQVVYRLQL